MVPGRPHRTERGRPFAPFQRVDRLQSGAGGQERGRPRVARDRGVGIELAAPALAEHLESVEIFGGVDPFEVLASRQPGREGTLRLGDAAHLETLEHRSEARRPLGMAATGIVLRIPGIRGDQRASRHATEPDREPGSP